MTTATIPNQNKPTPANYEWEGLRSFLDVNQEDFFHEVYALATEIACWFKSVSMFRRVEDKRMILGEPTEEDRLYHRRLLTVLRAIGSNILMRAKALNMAAECDQDGISWKDIEATIEELHNTELQWYGDMTDERKQQILTKVFDVPAGTD